MAESAYLFETAEVTGDVIIGENTLVKAGSLIPQRKEFEKDAVLEGFPAKEVGKNEGLLERPSWGFLHEKE